MRIVIFSGAFLGISIANAEILAGWNYFSPNNGIVNSCVNDMTPDVSATGISGNIGGNVNSAFPSTSGESRSGTAYDHGFDTFGRLVGTGSTAESHSLSSLPIVKNGERSTTSCH